MRIPFACAFIKLLASDKNTKHDSYLNFFPARYKACSDMWKFSKKFKESKMSDKTEVPDKSKIPDKLEKFLTGGDIILNCFIPGEGVNDIFEVTISNANDNRVSSLAEAIRNRRLDRFQDIDLNELALYRVDFISDSVVIQTLRNNEVFEVEGAVRMELQDRIFNHFSTQPQRIYSGEKKINVIVYPPTETVPDILSKDN